MSDDTRHRLWLITPLATLLAVIGIAIALPLIDSAPETGGLLTAPVPTTVAASDPGGEPVTVRPGVTADTIRVGVLASLSGDEAAVGRSLVDGQYLYWEDLDRYGGIGGYQIDVLVRDGGLDPDQAAGAYETLQPQVALISSSFGTAMIAEEALGDGLLVMADSPVAAWADLPNIVIDAAQASYAAEIWVGASWALGEGGLGGPVGILYQDDAYGEDCLTGYRAAINGLGLDHAAMEAYAAGAGDLNEQTAALAGVGAEVVYLCGDPLALGQFLVAADAAGYAPTIIATSASYSPHLAFALGDGEYRDAAAERDGLAWLGNVYVVSPVPAYEDGLPGMSAFRRAVDEAGIATDDVDLGLWIGYTQAATAHAILTTALQSQDLTRAGIAAAFHDTTSIDLGFGAPPAGYGPAAADRIPSTTAAVFRPISIEERVFGLEPVSGWITAP